MERKVGTISRGIRCPIIREGDDLVKIVTIAEDVRTKLGGETIGVIFRSCPGTGLQSACVELPKGLRR